MSEVLGKCPKCGADVVGGKYGPYCTGRCGIYLSKAFGKDLTAAQVKSLLDGKKVLLKGLISKNKGTEYDMYIKSNGVEDYTFTKKDGSEGNGARLKFETSFPEKKEEKKEPVIISEDITKPANFKVDTHEEVPAVEFGGVSDADLPF
nr:DUF3945 domain-containing protein [uncultured Butyrivibrio sp.]